VKAKKRIEVRSQTTVTLPCHVQNDQDKNVIKSIEWTRDGETITNSSTAPNVNVATKNGTHTIVFNPVLKNDQGRYQCTVMTSILGFDAPKVTATTFLAVLGMVF